jgi:DNA-binding response OmpR family regulator
MFRQGHLNADVHLITKPFTQQELARRVRQLLNEVERRATS